VHYCVHSPFGCANFRLYEKADARKAQVQNGVKEGFLFFLKYLMRDGGKKDIDKFDQALQVALFQSGFNFD
jgi:hypothetical protein